MARKLRSIVCMICGAKEGLLPPKFIFSGDSQYLFVTCGRCDDAITKGDN